MGVAKRSSLGPVPRQFFCLKVTDRDAGLNCTVSKEYDKAYRR